MKRAGGANTFARSPAPASHANHKKHAERKKTLLSALGGFPCKERGKNAFRLSRRKYLYLSKTQDKQETEMIKARMNRPPRSRDAKKEKR